MLLFLCLNRGSNIDIHINKTYHPNNTRIQGTVNCVDTGNVIIIANHGDLESLPGLNNLSELNINSIIGYQKLIKDTSSPVKYILGILPFYNLPMENVYILALLDKNQRIIIYYFS